MNQLSGIFQFQIHENTGGKVSDLILTINKVTEETISTQFRIKAGNELGTGEQAVKVTLFKREFTNDSFHFILMCVVAMTCIQ